MKNIKLKWSSFSIHPWIQGADFKNNQTTKQWNKFIWANRKQAKFCFFLPISLNRFVSLVSCLIVFKIRSQAKKCPSTRLGKDTHEISIYLDDDLSDEDDFDPSDVYGGNRRKKSGIHFFLKMFFGWIVAKLFKYTYTYTLFVGGSICLSVNMSVRM